MQVRQTSPPSLPVPVGTRLPDFTDIFVPFKFGMLKPFPLADPSSGWADTMSSIGLPPCYWPPPPPLAPPQTDFFSRPETCPPPLFLRHPPFLFCSPLSTFPPPYHWFDPPCSPIRLSFFPPRLPVRHTSFFLQVFFYAFCEENCRVRTGVSSV